MFVEGENGERKKSGAPRKVVVVGSKGGGTRRNWSTKKNSSRDFWSGVQRNETADGRNARPQIRTSETSPNGGKTLNGVEILPLNKANRRNR